MYYRIETSDGYKFRYEADDASCVDLVHGNNADLTFANESELLAWVAENIEGIVLFERIGIDQGIADFMNSGDSI